MRHLRERVEGMQGVMMRACKAVRAGGNACRAVKRSLSSRQSVISSRASGSCGSITAAL